MLQRNINALASTHSKADASTHPRAPHTHKNTRTHRKDCAIFFLICFALLKDLYGIRSVSAVRKGKGKGKVDYRVSGRQEDGKVARF
jgi:hypothetical protein